jgi:hypothetical protein
VFGPEHAIACTQKVITMLTILLCLTRIFIPDLAVLLSTLEVQSAIFAFAVFACLVGKLWLNASPRPARLRNINLYSV